MEGNRLIYTFSKESKSVLDKFLSTAESNKNSPFCNIQEHKVWKTILKCDDISKQEPIENTVCIDLTVDEVADESIKLQNEATIIEDDQNFTSDVKKSILEHLNSANRVPYHVLNEMQKYPSKYIEQIFKEFSDYLTTQQVILLGESLLMCLNKLFMGYFLGTLFIKKMTMVFTEEMKILFLRFFNELNQTTTLHLVNVISDYHELDTLVLYLAYLTPHMKGKLLSQLLRSLEDFQKKYILVFHHLLHEGLENDCLKRLMELLANNREEYTNCREYGKLVLKIVQYLGNDLHNIENEFKYIVSDHKSIWKTKLQKVLNTLSSDHTMLSLESQIYN